MTINVGVNVIIDFHSKFCLISISGFEIIKKKISHTHYLRSCVNILKEKRNLNTTTFVIQLLRSLSALIKFTMHESANTSTKCNMNLVLGMSVAIVS